MIKLTVKKESGYLVFSICRRKKRIVTVTQEYSYKLKIGGFYNESKH